MNEIWKDVTGFEGMYQVSNLGRVQSITRQISNGKPKKWTKKGTLLKKRVTWGGYVQVRLSNNGKSVYRSVQHLVAGAFIGLRPEGMVINHKDGNKENNNVANLEYCTKTENNRHAHAIGLVPPSSGKRKLTSAQVIEIRELSRAGYSGGKLSKMFGIGRPSISGILSGKKWKGLL